MSGEMTALQSLEAQATITPAAAKAKIDDLLAITAPPPIKGTSLQQVLGLAKPVKGLYVEFMEPPMTLRRLEPFVEWLNAAYAALDSANTRQMLEFSRACACQLLYVQEGDSLRAATQDEIADNFSMDIIAVVDAALERAGLKAEPGAGEAVPPTGGAS